VQSAFRAVVSPASKVCSRCAMVRNNSRDRGTRREHLPESRLSQLEEVAGADGPLTGIGMSNKIGS